MAITNKIYTYNHMVPEYISKITNWHYERNLIYGSTDDKQAYKLLEEYLELVSAIHPDYEPESLYDMVSSWLTKLLNTGKIKTTPVAVSDRAKRDAIGDMNVVQVNIAERNGYTVHSCLEQAWYDIRDRGGKMVDGIYVKSEDINNESLR